MRTRGDLRTAIPATCAFLLLATLTVGGWAPLAAADRAIGEAFRELGNANPTLIAWVRVATDVAATIPVLAAGVLLTLFLAVRGERRSAIFTAATTVAVPTLWSLMHLWLPHARPDNGFVTVASYGFPSGHTSNATAVALVAVVLLSPRRSRRATAGLVLGAALFALLIGLSRLVLLAHWPTQVLGGWLLGLAVVPFLAHYLPPHRPAAPPAVPPPAAVPAVPPPAVGPAVPPPAAGPAVPSPAAPGPTVSGPAVPGRAPGGPGGAGSGPARPPARP